MQKTHDGSHGDACFGCRIQSVQFGSMVPHTRLAIQADKDFVKDNAAYRRLKKDGIQPKGVNKSAQLEMHMDHKIEAKLGRVMGKTERRLYNTEAPGKL